MKNYKTSKKQVELYQLRRYSGFEWANIYVNESGPESGELVINSDFGNWAYYWSHCGCPFKKFLIDSDTPYLTKKLNGSTRKEIDFDKTKIAILEDIAEHSKYLLDEEKLTKEQLQNEVEKWNDFFSDEWENETLMYKLLNDDYWDSFKWLYGGDYESIPIKTDYEVGIKCFMSQLWPVFIEQLQNELDGINTGG